MGVHGFRTAHVFDVAQTDGDPLPTLAHDAAGDPGVHLAALEQAIANAGVVITRLSDLGGAQGYSQPGCITIRGSLSTADTAAVLVHDEGSVCFAYPAVYESSEGVDDPPVSQIEVHVQLGEKKGAVTEAMAQLFN